MTAAWPRIEHTRRAVRAESAADLAAAAELGIQVHTLTAKQRERWRTATAGVTTELINTVGGRSAEVIALIEQARQDYRAALE